MRNCIDEGTLQAWFDGELAGDEAAQVAAHVNTCAQCAAAVSNVEAESLILSEALATEFAATVPTERLRQQIDMAVAGLPQQKVSVKGSRWNLFTEFFSLRPLAYASAAAMILLVAIIGFVYLKNHQPTSVANNNKSTVVVPSPKQSPEQVAQRSPEQVTVPDSNSPQRIAYKRQPARRVRSEEPAATSLAWQERQYENAIAKLDEALKTQPPMRPALQVEYEYNMAVIDNAIATTRDAAKKNPKDPLANQFMLAAYQSKVDFMNQIADARGLGR